jgi:hypothetical protein
MKTGQFCPIECKIWQATIKEQWEWLDFLFASTHNTLFFRNRLQLIDHWFTKANRGHQVDLKVAIVPKTLL